MSISLRDLAPMREIVPIRGQDVVVYGVSAHRINQLISRFQQLRQILLERGDRLSNDDIRQFAPDVICTFIAESMVAPEITGEKREKIVAEEEQGARNLTAGEQFEIIERVVAMTFPKGVGPFVELLKKVGVIAPAAAGNGSAAASENPGKSSGDTGREQALKSVLLSNELPEGGTTRSI